MQTSQLYYYKELHSKLYLNEDRAILTSMNLHEFSQNQNREAGLLVLKDEEEQLYEEVRKEAFSIFLAASQIAKPKAENAPASPSSANEAKATATTQGSCIRCRKALPYDLKKPYCRECIRKRKRDPRPFEQYCHQCGTPEPSTLEQPRCPSAAQ